MAKLRVACEKAKKELSFAGETQLNVDALKDDEDLDIIITRAKFVQLCADIFDRCMPLLDKVLEDAKL